MRLTASSFTAFGGDRRLARGPLTDVAVAVWQALSDSPETTILVFDDSNGAVVDLDLRGGEDGVRARYAVHPDLSSDDGPSEDRSSTRGRGRPRLGVLPREVTLLPRHWEWLATQQGGASATLRRLVEEARRSHQVPDALRASHEAAYRFMVAMGGDRPGFEDAARALFASDQQGFSRHIAAWPAELNSYARYLAGHSKPNDADE